MPSPNNPWPGFRRPIPGQPSPFPAAEAEVLVRPLPPSPSSTVPRLPAAGTVEDILHPMAIRALAADVAASEALSIVGVVLGGVLGITLLIGLGFLAYWAMARLQSASHPGLTASLPPAETPPTAPSPLERKMLAGGGILAEPRILGNGWGAPIVYLEFSPDGRSLATLGQRGEFVHEVLLWDIAAGMARTIQEARPGAPSASMVRPLAFSEDGRLLAWRPDFEGRFQTIRTWDTVTGREGERWDNLGGASTQITFAPGTHNLITCDFVVSPRISWFEPGKKGAVRIHTIGRNEWGGPFGVLSPSL